MVTSEHVKQSEGAQKPDYPYLAQYKDEHIVLFVSHDSGAIVKADPTRKLGHQCTSWIEEDFTPLPEGEQVILTQGGKS